MTVIVLVLKRCNKVFESLGNVINYNATIYKVIDMASYSCPLLDTLHMVKYNPHIL